MKLLQKLVSKSFTGASWNAFKSLSAPSLCRWNSSSNKSVHIKQENGIAKILLNRAPVNSIVPEFFRDIAEAVEEAEKNKCRGIILTSVSLTLQQKSIRI